MKLISVDTLEDYRITVGNPLPTAKNVKTDVVTIGSTPIVSVGNIMAIAGSMPDLRKGVLLSLMCSAVSKKSNDDDNFIFNCDNNDNGAVIFINTENWKAGFECELEAALSCHGIKEMPENLHTYHIPLAWPISSEDIVNAVFASAHNAQAERSGVKLILVDGYEALVGNGLKNRKELVGKTILKLRLIASSYNTAIVLTAHKTGTGKDYGGRSLRELRQECETILSVGKSELRLLGGKSKLANVGTLFNCMRNEIEELWGGKRR